MNNGCDCQDVRTPALTEPGLALYAHVRQVRHHLAQLLRDSPELIRSQGEVLLVRGELVPLLRRVLAALTYTQAQEARAAPWDGETIDYAHSASLSTWTDRLDSPWYGSATQSLHFVMQPIVALASGRVHGHEALVRARVGDRDISAGALLQAAAAHEQVAVFDARARSQAIVQVYPLLAAGEHLFINFSPTVIYDPEICLGATFRTATETGADISRLVFEVTEGHAFPDLALLRKILDQYRDQGARVALDDMGSGHTSLLYLAALMPDYVKLDRGLLSGLRHGDPRVPLLGAMIRYAHDLDIRVIAEGIETLVELEILQNLGADYAQGYFLAYPDARPPALTPAARNYLDRARSSPRPSPTPDLSDTTAVTSR